MDPNILQETNENPDDMQVLREDVKLAIQSLKGGKSLWIDNVPVIKGGIRDSEGAYHTVLEDIRNQTVATRVDAIAGHTPA